MSADVGEPRIDDQLISVGVGALNSTVPSHHRAQTVTMPGEWFLGCIEHSRLARDGVVEWVGIAARPRRR
jgi:hypothetical protein